MENEAQLNQNPMQQAAPEENSLNQVEQSVNEFSTSAQSTDDVTPQPKSVISDTETKRLVDLMQSNKLYQEAAPKKKAGEAVKSEQAAEKQLTDAEAALAGQMMHSDQDMTTDEVNVETAQATPAISKKEKELALSLMDADHLGDDADHDEDEDHIETVFEYEGLNKLQLVELLEETVTDADISVIKAKVAAIKVKFLKLNKEDIEQELAQFLSDGGNRDEYAHADDPLEVRFKAAFNTYKENKAHFNELLEKKKSENLREKQSILEELKHLISSEETLKKTYDEFKILQDKWKSIGQVPAAEITNLWNNYHFLVEKFFDKVKINKELRDLDLKKNLEAKIEICERAEELLLESSIIKSFKMLQKLHDDWKEIGPAPQDKKDEIWERFKNATDKINLIRREHYNKVQEEQQHNYDAKVALCEKMEELTVETAETINDWNAKSDLVSEYFNVWRSLGQAPKKLNDEIWSRFKTAMDAFFESKKEFFSKIKDQQLENYNRKLDLCAQAEALKDSSEWRKTTDQLKQLQEEWKKIGPVPKKNSDKVWKRFRAACDAFFVRKAEFFGSIRDVESENLNQKKELITQIAAFEVSKDKHANLEALRGFQRRWMEIGHVPIKMKDQLQGQYRKAIDALFDKMKITEVEMNTTEYRGMVEGMKDEPESQDRIRRERFGLTNKIAKLRDEINLWENNIGFFANSKNAEIMKAEYEKKINQAKNDLKLLEAKLKILKD